MQSEPHAQQANEYAQLLAAGYAPAAVQLYLLGACPDIAVAHLPSLGGERGGMRVRLVPWLWGAVGWARDGLASAILVC
jgi:hypothetical protein